MLCDRYADSTVAYQHHGRGIERSAVDAANAVATGGLTPDLTLLLDLPPAAGLRRAGRARRLHRARGPSASTSASATGYLAEASADSERWLVLDATEPPGVLVETAWGRIRALTES